MSASLYGTMAQTNMKVRTGGPGQAMGQGTILLVCRFVKERKSLADEKREYQLPLIWV